MRPEQVHLLEQVHQVHQVHQVRHNRDSGRTCSASRCAAVAPACTCVHLPHVTYEYQSGSVRGSLSLSENHKLRGADFEGERVIVTAWYGLLLYLDC